jgi:hypothetical protein
MESIMAKEGRIMKALKALLTIVVFVCFAGQASATATYDANAYLRFSYNISESSQNSDIDGSWNGTGTHGEWGGWMHLFGNGEGVVQAWVMGLAGDASGTQAGTSDISLISYQTATFDFPSAFTFTLTLLDYRVESNHSTDFVWEDAWANASVSMLMDGQDIWFDGSGLYSQTMTGTHTLVIKASASGHAEANPVPEPATMLLLGLGLMGLAGIRRKM